MALRLERCGAAALAWITKLASSFIAAILALGAPAHATEIGDVIRFELPTIGCINFDDAREALRVRTLYGLRRALSFTKKRDSRGHYLCVSRDNPAYEFLVVDKRTQPNARSAWFCIEATGGYDVHSPAERRAALAELPRPPCFWVSSCPDGPPPADRPTEPHSPECK